MSTTKNLWGELPLAEVIRTPTTILREQATQLTELTKGLLEGEVTSRKVDSIKPFFSRLSIVVPALDNYKYVVMDVFHDIVLYPVVVTDRANGQQVECNDEPQFMDIVEKILSSAAVHKAIAALLSQSASEQELFAS